MQRSKSAVQQP
jgi:hypothetical protein